jgi:hypothetical protein
VCVAEPTPAPTPAPPTPARRSNLPPATQAGRGKTPTGRR